jgi:hypothetical protein
VGHLAISSGYLESGFGVGMGIGWWRFGVPYQTEITGVSHVLTIYLSY